METPDKDGLDGTESFYYLHTILSEHADIA